MRNSPASLVASATAVVAWGADAAALGRLDDDELLAAQTSVAEHRRALDTHASWIAAEIARRSRREAGHSGLAQRKGFVSAEALIQSVSQSSRAEASKFVQLGTLLAEVTAEEGRETPDPNGRAWHAPIAEGLSAGRLSSDGAEAIRRGLGDAGAEVTAGVLADAASRLVGEAEGLSAEQLFRLARGARDRIDEAGVADRERQRHEARYLKRWIRPDGMYQASMLLDPENGRLVFSALDAVLSPRRGGPRFVDPKERARAEALLADQRTDEQLALDALVSMVRIAGEADPGTLFGTARPSVRIVVTERAVTTRNGHGYLEGGSEAISLPTIERHLCDAGLVGVKFDDDGQCVNVGRDQRLFTARQRVGLAVRDGGCRFPGCDRPPSWCEAHHIDQWHRDHGRTDIADGILLCRHHHLLVHNNRWRVIRDVGDYWLRPPRSEDPSQTLRPMPSRSPVMAEVLSGAGPGVGRA